MIDFNIVSSLPLSLYFKSITIHSFEEACFYIRQLPFKRNADKSDPECVLKDGFGTCGTKHAILKRLAEENSRNDIKLILGIFAMSKRNTPSVKHVLDKFQLEYIPEAHNYLRVDGKIIDCTKKGFGEGNFINDLMHEVEIEPSQITDFKVKQHQEFIRNWLRNEKAITRSFDEIWAIREECILALST